MMNSGGVDERNASPKSKGLPRLAKKKMLFFVAVLAVVVIVVIALLAASLSGGKKPTRTESYKDVTGSAGLDASISYKCDKQPCPFDFNVYILRDDGQQVAVVRPDKEGKVQLAFQEGNYVMLIGKQFGKDNLFPQEPLALKNGKMLELKLDYK